MAQGCDRPAEGDGEGADGADVDAPDARGREAEGRGRGRVHVPTRHHRKCCVELLARDGVHSVRDRHLLFCVGEKERENKKEKRR